jgi:gamma-glutamyltranspeptidase
MGRNPVLSHDYMIVAGHPAASVAASRIMDRGGGVADAAIAGAAVLTVVLPSACSLGGDAFILAHDSVARRTSGINASGPAPAALDPAAYCSAIPAKGGTSVTVPGVVAGWSELHRRFGQLPWKDLFADAIRLADAGFPVSPGLAQASRLSHQQLAADPGCRALFLVAGEPLAPGDRLQQRALARTMRRLSEGGAEAFYHGPIADGLARAVARAGGVLRADDLASYRPEWVTPIETVYRGLTVRVMPPNSYGLYMLLQLNALAGESLADLDLLSPRRFERLIAAAAAAFTEGRRYVADPRGAPAIAEALAPAMTARLHAAMAQHLRPTIDARGGTAVILVADGHGNAVNLVQSVFTLFGSAVADSETGIVLHDRMLGFTNRPGEPNTIAPGKRPAHTLNPVMAFDGAGGLRYLMGTPGGPGQTITLTQVLSAMVDGGAAPTDAVLAPRWSMEAAGTPLLEQHVPHSVHHALQAAGYRVVVSPPGSPFFGSAQVIERLDDGVLVGAADERREPFVLGG